MTLLTCQPHPSTPSWKEHVKSKKPNACASEGDYTNNLVPAVGCEMTTFQQ
jgi:hypothetical protein